MVKMLMLDVNANVNVNVNANANVRDANVNGGMSRRIAINLPCLQASKDVGKEGTIGLAINPMFRNSWNPIVLRR